MIQQRDVFSCMYWCAEDQNHILYLFSKSISGPDMPICAFSRSLYSCVHSKKKVSPNKPGLVVSSKQSPDKTGLVVSIEITIQHRSLVDLRINEH